MALSCAKKEKEVTPPSKEGAQEASEPFFYAKDLLPGDIETYELALVDTIQIVRAGEADSTLGREAKRYLSCNFIGLTAAA